MITNSDRVTDIIDQKLREALLRSGTFVDRMTYSAAPSRDQLHQILDQVLDLGVGVFALTRPLRNVLREWATPVAGGADRRPATPRSVNVLTLSPVSPGGQVEGQIEVRNDGHVPLNALRLQCAGLVADGPQRIDGRHVELHPAQLDLPGRSRATVNVRLHVPETAQPGNYVGVIAATGRPLIQAIVSVEIL